MKNHDEDITQALPQGSSDDMLPEYDFSSAKPNTHAKRRQKGYTTIVHHADGSTTETAHGVQHEQLGKPLSAGHSITWNVLEVS